MSEEELAAQAKADAEAAVKAAEEAKAAATSKSISQEEFDKIIGRRVAETQTATEKALLQKLQDETGMSADELKELAKTHKERQDAEKSELDKLREANEAQKRDSEATATKLQKDNHALAVKLQLSQAGLALPEDKAESLKALERVVGLVSAPVGASTEDIDANIEELKAQFPALFQAPDQVNPGPTGNPPSNPPGGPRKPIPGTSNPADIGTDRAAQMNARRGVKPTA